MFTESSRHVLWPRRPIVRVLPWADLLTGSGPSELGSWLSKHGRQLVVQYEQEVVDDVAGRALGSPRANYAAFWSAIHHPNGDMRGVNKRGDSWTYHATNCSSHGPTLTCVGCGGQRQCW
jgi:hypothetical protein